MDIRNLGLAARALACAFERSILLQMPPSAVCEVRMIGTDASEQPFWQTAIVSAAALHFVELARVPGICQEGQIVTLEYDNRQRRYIVTAVHEDGSARLDAIAEADSIFPADLLNGDESRPAFWDEHRQPADTTVPVAEKHVRLAQRPNGIRRYTRRNVRTAVVVREISSGRDVCGEMTEMSAGGCYVEMWSPLSLGTDLEVRCDDPKLRFRAAGRVVYSDPLVGMGIAFAAPCFFGESEGEGGSQGLTNGSQAPRSPEANARLVSALETWFADHMYLEKIDYLRFKERSEQQ